jgi:NADP-dependent 3-hydroxy acid dehydrogenase YdfG
MTELSGQVALVTGGGSGIGRAISVELAAHGATVWLAGRRPDALSETADAIRRTGGTAVCRPLDLTDDTQVTALAAELGTATRGVGILVHAAAVIALGAVRTAPVDDLDRQYRVNLRAPFLLTQQLLPGIETRRGQIVFVNSSAGQVAPPHAAQYAATKFGLRALADSLRAQVNDLGVRVLSVYPGRTATPMGAAVMTMEGRAYDAQALAQPEDIAALVISALLVPRTAEVTDVVIRQMRKLQ